MRFEWRQITDGSRDRLPLVPQVGYVALLALGIMAALWQHGEPHLVLLLLALTGPAVVVSRLPRGRLTRLGLKSVQALSGAAAVAWWYGRSHHVSPDLALAESIAILGVALSLRGAPGEYSSLATLSFVLVGYGGVAVARGIYFPAAAGFVTVGVLLLYHTRLVRLASLVRTPAWDPHAETGPLSWPYLLLHFLLFLGLWGSLAFLLPLPSRRSLGAIPVQYEAGQPQQVPLLWADWFRSGLVAESPRGLLRTDSESLAARGRGGAPRVTDLWVGRSSVSARGSGGGAVGRDLVCRVWCPEKLYWLASLYDEYDGETWRTSAALAKGQVVRRPDRPIRGRRLVTQYVSIEKALSPQLYAAFLVQSCRWGFRRDADRPPDPDRAAGEPLRQAHLYGYSLLQPYPPLPWRFQCNSRVICLDPAADAAVWEEQLPKEHYLTLPQAAVTPRLKALADDISARTRTPLERALAIRDYLRRSLSYTLTPAPAPAGQSVLEHFLFESQQGYCVHFAEALTVLARACGLPARVATGFSPGHYNVLTGAFEVYEYHGHAWSQVYVTPYGWLTLDGVPPGEMRLESVPVLIGGLRDPLRGDWSTRPPELSVRSEAQAHPQVATDSDAFAEHGGGFQAGIRRALAEVVTQVYQRQGAGREHGSVSLAKAVIQALWQQLGSLGSGLAAALSAWLDQLRTGLPSLGRRLLLWGSNLGPGQIAGLVTAACLTTAALALHRRLEQWLDGQRRARRCRRLWREIQFRLREPADRVLSLCAVLVRESLVLGRFPRPARLDAVEFAESVADRDPGLARDLTVVYAGLSRHLYSRHGLAAEELSRVVAATGRVFGAMAGEERGSGKGT